MTAAELRALIAKATPGGCEFGIRRDQSLWLSLGDPKTGPHYQGDLCASTGDAALIVALRNNAERFAELLAAEEAKAEPKREWTSCRPCDGWDYRVDGVYAGQVWPSSSGEWWWCLRDNLDNGIEPTQLLARAAVEAAVRAGR